MRRAGITARSGHNAAAGAGLVRERLGVTIALENLAPLYPGAETLSSNPLVLRGLVQRIGSDRVTLCLDLGHAHVIADRCHTGVEHLCEPVLDLHLPPGRGTLPWKRLRPLLAAHEAPLMLEVHPPHRPRAGELAAAAARVLSPGTSRES